MQAELTLNTKCPACGALKPKTLAAIKAQELFACDCGFQAKVRQGKQKTTAREAAAKRAATTTA